MSIWMKWAVPSVLEVFSATFVLNRWIWLFSTICHFFKNFEILSDFDAPAKNISFSNDKIPFRTRPIFLVPFQLNSSPAMAHFWPNQFLPTDFRAEQMWIPSFSSEFLRFGSILRGLHSLKGIIENKNDANCKSHT